MRAPTVVNANPIAITARELSIKSNNPNGRPAVANSVRLNSIKFGVDRVPTIKTVDSAKVKGILKGSIKNTQNSTNMHIRCWLAKV